MDTLLQKVQTRFPYVTAEKLADILSMGQIVVVQPGEKVKLIFADHAQVYPVVTATGNEFEVNEQKEGSVFVFGREVNDFRVVDYEALAMLNVSATQQLLKMIVEQQKENEKMREQWSTLQNEVGEIKHQLLLKSTNTDRRFF